MQHEMKKTRWRTHHLRFRCWRRPRQAGGIFPNSALRKVVSTKYNSRYTCLRQTRIHLFAPVCVALARERSYIMGLVWFGRTGGECISSREWTTTGRCRVLMVAGRRVTRESPAEACEQNVAMTGRGTAARHRWTQHTLECLGLEQGFDRQTCALEACAPKTRIAACRDLGSV